MTAYNIILENLEIIIHELGFNTPAKLSISKNQKFGDLSTNAPLVIGKQIGKNPLDIAKLISDKINISDNVIESINITKPGFINFTISNSYFYSMLKNNINNKDFGKNEIGKNKTANVEFVSANPTGPLTIGHGRNGVIGDIVSNILEWNGYDVTREYYFNNAGRQMRVLGESVKARYFEIIGKPIEFPENGYMGDYIKDIAKEIKKSKGNNILPEDSIFKDLAESMMFTNIKKTLMDLNIKFDRFSNEKDYYDNGSIDKMIAELKNKDLIYNKDGAVWFKATQLGKNQDKVYIKKSGEPTYRVPDTAYHRDKIERGYDLIVDIFGADHNDAYPDVMVALDALGHDTSHIKVLIYQFVTLIRDGKKIKMSTRNADFVTMRELVSQLSSDVIRYFFIMRGMNSHLNFDLSLAEDQSEKNPVFYLQYAHARICNIIKRAHEIKIENLDDYNPKLLKNKTEIGLLKQIDRFPNLVISAIDSLEPQTIASYLNDMAASFHRFYNESRVISDDIDITKARIALIRLTKIVLNNGLRILGISAPEKM